MDAVEVVEGRARLRVPAGNKDRGPGAHDSAVFFNPAMALSRDLSVLVLDALAPPGGWSVLDGLAATGARAVRLALEVPRARVTANDLNPVAAERCAENARANGVDVNVTRRNLGALLWEGEWDWVDVDPFGSPVDFVDAATRAVARHGILAVTATDATALAGVYPDVCERRYGARPLRGEAQHETALRILAGSVVRTGARRDVALTPVLAHATDHYYRVYLRADRGAGRATDAMRASQGFAFVCAACGDRGIAARAPVACRACAGAVGVAGPLWSESLNDAAVARAARALVEKHGLARAEETAWLLDVLAEEAEAPPLLFDLARVASRAGAPQMPPRERVMDALRERGFGAWRTHVLPTGIKTRASAAELADVVRSL